ncbi:unnamed protein product [Rotaria sp. Silwood1]|nr:unnamed protein product [Rotaria sp. Silwood1]CAF1660669.1 unnamed protein product [Rotaria sp. Silwood1]CAF3826944.1 unnamed protein product [Rotaria sp. Silwood1]CAF4600982.1 unnamed protein product [Rotaria sp. Silwood1]
MIFVFFVHYIKKFALDIWDFYLRDCPYNFDIALAEHEEHLKGAELKQRTKCISAIYDDIKCLAIQHDLLRERDLWNFDELDFIKELHRMRQRIVRNEDFYKYYSYRIPVEQTYLKNETNQSSIEQTIREQGQTSTNEQTNSNKY